MNRRTKKVLVLATCLLIFCPGERAQASYQKSYKLPPVETGGGRKTLVLPDLRIKVKKKKHQRKKATPLSQNQGQAQPQSKDLDPSPSLGRKVQQGQKIGEDPVQTQDQSSWKKANPPSPSGGEKEKEGAKSEEVPRPNPNDKNEESQLERKNQNKSLNQDPKLDSKAEEAKEKFPPPEEVDEMEEEKVQIKESEEKEEDKTKDDDLDDLPAGTWTFGPYAQSIQPGQALPKLKEEIEIIGQGGDPSQVLTLTRDGELVLHPNLIKLEDKPGHFLLDPDLFQLSGRYLVRLGHGKDCQEISFILDRDPPLVEKGKIHQEGGEARLRLLVYDRTGLDLVDPILGGKNLDSYSIEKEEDRKTWLSLPAEPSLQVLLKDGVGNVIRFVYEEGRFKQVGLDGQTGKKGGGGED